MNLKKTKNTKDALEIGWASNRISQSEINMIIG